MNRPRPAAPHGYRVYFRPPRAASTGFLVSNGLRFAPDDAPEGVGETGSHGASLPDVSLSAPTAGKSSAWSAIDSEGDMPSLYYS